MEIRKAQMIPMGMNQDLSVSKFTPNLSFKNRNIRITARNSNTLMSIENEMGNTIIPLKSPDGGIELLGTCIGYTVLNDYMVIFTTQTVTDTVSVDRIYRISEYNRVVKLCELNLGFSIKNPIECVTFYETEFVQKVYWTDGKNQPRVINIVAEKEDRDKWDNTSFNFSQNLTLNEVVTITKSNSGGQFAAGVIQYAFTYFRVSGPETNIFQTSDLYYLSASDRALNGEQTSSNSFTIQVENIDKRFEYLRVYSIHRSSLNSTPTVKIVLDYKITGDTATIQDTGYYGDDVDSTKLLYVGGEDIVAGTITSKDNTLFAGNIKITRDATQIDDIVSLIGRQTFNWEYREPEVIESESKAINALYTYLPNSLFNPASDYRHFKNGQVYRFGIQLQRENGRWSDPIYLGGNDYSTSHDKLCNKPFITSLSEAPYSKVNLYLNKGVLTIDTATSALLLSKGFKRVRPVMVMPELSDRSVLAQGIITSTLGFDRLRENNTSFSYVDYVARPHELNHDFRYIPSISDPKIPYSGLNVLNGKPEVSIPNLPSYGHFLSPRGSFEMSDNYTEYIIKSSAQKDTAIKFPFQFQYGDTFSFSTIKPLVKEFNESPISSGVIPFIDENIVSFWSPEFQYNETLNSYIDEDTYCVITGLAGIASSSSSTNANLVAGGISGNASGYMGRGTYGSSNWSIGAKLKTAMESIDIDGREYTYAVLSTISSESFTFSKNKGTEWLVYDLKYKTVGWLQYSLANYMFDSSKSELRLPINKPVQILSTEKVIPYSTFSEDNGGTITYNAQPDELFLPDGIHICNIHKSDNTPAGEDIQPKAVVFKYKTNSHGLFSFGLDKGIDNKEGSLTIPKFTNNTSRNRVGNISTPAYTRGQYTLSISATTPIFTSDGRSVSYTVSYQVSDGVNGDSINNLQYPNKIDIPVYFKLYSSQSAEDATYVGDYTTKYSFLVEKNTLSGTFSVSYTTEYGDRYLRSIYTPGEDGNGISWGTIKSPADSTTISLDQAIVGGGSSPILLYTSIIEDPGGGGSTGDNAGIYSAPFYRNGGKGTGFIKKIININEVNISGEYSKYNNLFSSATLSEDAAYFVLTELRKNVITPYGGFTKEAIDNNTWIPCGPSTRINKNTPSKVEYLSGDTFVGRYDCLRTYSDTSQVQRVYNVVSFLCESYTNLDGRYDRNRYNIDVRDKTIGNFGLLNEVYSQRDNYFTYRTLNLKQFKATNFPSQVLWSPVKNSGELTDSWTTLNLSSTLDLDGSLGPINGIKTFNSEIVAFQDKGIANVLFNSRVQIPTSDEIPIEISNNYKVSGYRYMSNQIGAKNKWSINQTKNGLYFIDDLNKTINLINGEGIIDLSVQKGFKSWSNNNIADYGPLRIGTSDTGDATNQMNTYITSVDKLNNDVYFTNSKHCLCFSETMGNFTSFFDYQTIPFMFSYQDDFISIRNIGNKTQLYLQNVGKFNEFFGAMYPSEVDYIFCPDATLDKVFNNIEFRADCFTKDIEPDLRITEKDDFRITENKAFRILQSGKLKGYFYNSFRTLDMVECENEFQYGVFDWLAKDKKQLKKKFRVWRSALPRHKGTLNRIRNPWTHVKVHYRPNELEDNRLVLHDMVIYYTVTN